jgi:Cft2 family RNA processing exonuclease
MIKIKTFESGSTGNLHLLQYGEKKLLLECGLPIAKIKEYLDFDLNIDGCLLSHCHMDHAESAIKIMEHGIDLYCSQETALVLKLSGHRLKIVRINDYFSISAEKLESGWHILPMKTKHVDGSLAFLIDIGQTRTLFATDTGSFKYYLNGLTHLMIECNWSEKTASGEYMGGTIGKHMSLNAVLDFLACNDLSKVQEIHLIHLSQRNANAEYFKTECQKATGKPIYIG